MNAMNTNKSAYWVTGIICKASDRRIARGARRFSSRLSYSRLFVANVVFSRSCAILDPMYSITQRFTEAREPQRTEQSTGGSN
jgi:hypothetical protein